MTDIELLSQHRNGSESAFADLVGRHLHWVYGVARRRLRDAHLAEDVAQAVFVLLHRKAPQFAADRAMISWLYRTAWYASEAAARSERRREVREARFAMSRPEAVEPHESAEWREMAPILDRLVGKLPRTDREALLLRYYRDMSIAEVAEQIGATPEATRKRIERAIERLRQLASNNGATVSSGFLAAGLSQFIRIPPPPGLLATSTVAATAPAGSAMAASSVSLVKGTTTMMATSKILIGSVAALALMLAVGAIWGTVWIFADGQLAQSDGQSPTTAPANPPAEAPAAPAVPFDAHGSFPKLAPFAGIRWRGDVPEVQVDAMWYELVAVDGFPVEQIFNSQRATGDFDWRKHFGEDLIEVMSEMHHPPGDTVDLQVRALDGTGALTTLKNVPMTKDNQNSLMVWPADQQTTLFSDIRWNDAVPQVEIHGTWYELISVEKQSARHLVDSAKDAYGDDWQNQFQKNLLQVIRAKSRGTLFSADVQLRTLDYSEQVMMTVRVPQPK